MGNVFGRSTSGIPISAAWREEPWQHQFQKPCLEILDILAETHPQAEFFFLQNH